MNCKPEDLAVILPLPDQSCQCQHCEVHRASVGQFVRLERLMGPTMWEFKKPIWVKVTSLGFCLSAELLGMDDAYLKPIRGTGLGKTTDQDVTREVTA